MGVPDIKAVRELARTRFFRVEALDLKFANGVERTYELCQEVLDKDPL